MEELNNKHLLLPFNSSKMNHLKHESSPYLLQHANNPVHWFPWCDEAFELALEENKPVLLSIGYSSCHWCHVMAHESFEDPETADLMNALYINIKVDREEYPDIDHLYMDAVQAMTGSGGWPLNVFLTPDKRPFYGGTYFPPKRAFNRASWKEVLINVSQYFTQNRGDVDHQATQLMTHLANLSKVGQPDTSSATSDDSTPEWNPQQAMQLLMKQADKVFGGFGSAPKFPSTFALQFLLDYHQCFRESSTLDHVNLSLSAMGMGGIWDHLGGGFSRYSTDVQWIAPHFEKMLYDNALLMGLYARTYGVTGNEDYAEVVKGIRRWLEREMTDGSGAFYSAQDADTEGVEGKFYTWSYEELKTLLGDGMNIFAPYYQVTEEGNWEHTNILYTTEKSLSLHGKSHQDDLAEMKRILFEHRSLRPAPLTDDKSLLAWNALMNNALTTAYLHLGDHSYLDLALKNMDFILTHMRDEMFLFKHQYKSGISRHAAYADDLVYLADALIRLGNSTGNPQYVIQMREIMEFLLLHFSDPESVLINFAHRDARKTEIEKKDIYDGAVPSVNSMFCKLLFDGAVFFQEISWETKAGRMLEAILGSVRRHPSSFAIWAEILLSRASEFLEISIVGDQASDFFRTIYTRVDKPFVTYLVSNKNEEKIEALKGKYRQGETLVYICKGTQCLEPVSTIQQAMELIN
ncbi:MAG: thioredoxin domain-containing protein [Chitinophagaceae bacterium]|nr:thioredoxin domain-containing protein [Chitinophagaceae bacterium]